MSPTEQEPHQEADNDLITEVVEHILRHAALRLQHASYLRRPARRQLLHNLFHPVQTIIGGHLTGTSHAETTVYAICRNFS
jgi:hypothetical protein